MLGALLVLVVSAGLELPPPPHPVTANTNKTANKSGNPFPFFISLRRNNTFLLKN
jgi:hypothetical protein